MRQPRSAPARENQDSAPGTVDPAIAPKARLPRRKLGHYTIHDVAALAEVSSITVSRYFNTPSKVSPALREKLGRVIQETGFVPSQMAGRLASGDSRVVGAVMQNTGSTTFAALVQGMTEGFEESGLQLLLANTDYSRIREERAIHAFTGWHPRALILTRDDHSPTSDALLGASRCPIVETWGVVPGRPFHQVGFPHAEVGIRLTRHFLEQGARRIRFVLRDAPQDFRAMQRAQGYAEAMRAHGLVPDIASSSATDEFEAGEESIHRFRLEPPAARPQALIFASDHMAVGAALLAPELDLEFPRDCGIAGFGDAPMSSRLRPGLTTMRPEPYAIGHKAARLVLHLLADRSIDAAPQVHLVPCELVVRGSSLLTA